MDPNSFFNGLSDSLNSGNSPNSKKVHFYFEKTCNGHLPDHKSFTEPRPNFPKICLFPLGTKKYFVKTKTRLCLGNYLPEKSITGKNEKVIKFFLNVSSYLTNNIVFYYVHGRAFSGAFLVT